MRENITIWSSSKMTKFDDLDTIKHQLLRNRQNVAVNVLFSRLIKDQKDVRTYVVDYEYIDLNSTASKGKINNV